MDGDITLSGEWTTIPSFKGTLDGAGYKISDMKVSGGAYEEDDGDLNYYFGFIGEMKKDALISDITFENFKIELTENTLTEEIADYTKEYSNLDVHVGLVALNKGTIDEVFVNADISVNITETEARLRVGAVAGKNNKDITNSESSGTLSCINYDGYIREGGLTGYMSKAGICKDCASTAALYAEVTKSGKMNIGGLIGNLESGTVSGCTSSGDITVKNTAGEKGYAGAFIGRVDNQDDADYSLLVVITNCEASGKVEMTKKKTYASGFIGIISTYASDETRKITIENCKSTSYTVTGVTASEAFIGDEDYGSDPDTGEDITVDDISQTVHQMSGNTYILSSDGGISSKYATYSPNDE